MENIFLSLVGLTLAMKFLTRDSRCCSCEFAPYASDTGDDFRVFPFTDFSLTNRGQFGDKSVNKPCQIRSCLFGSDGHSFLLGAR